MGCLLVSFGAWSSSSEAALVNRSSDGNAEEVDARGSSAVIGSGESFDDLCRKPLKALEARKYAESGGRACEGIGDDDVSRRVREVEASEERVALLSI